ncbi:uncharacterized protein KY384_003902 [Bacidia gigantensis]|uniref:uncharacterized protein n=1 Tax=Bacidia gigantensis TaxID=2732470 RepID=UPI001D03D836|nr:uncharacterized protein KY384_003902 [Bacidia gigantensis]KAG8532261.1 hypothetical protein KY384_003902 [Bacidia gigantensis]
MSILLMPGILDPFREPHLEPPSLYGGYVAMFGTKPSDTTSSSRNGIGKRSSGSTSLISLPSVPLRASETLMGPVKVGWHKTEVLKQLMNKKAPNIVTDRDPCSQTESSIHHEDSPASKPYDSLLKDDSLRQVFEKSMRVAVQAIEDKEQSKWATKEQDLKALHQIEMASARAKLDTSEKKVQELEPYKECYDGDKSPQEYEEYIADLVADLDRTNEKVNHLRQKHKAHRLRLMQATTALATEFQLLYQTWGNQMTELSCLAKSAWKGFTWMFAKAPQVGAPQGMQQMKAEVFRLVGLDGDGRQHVDEEWWRHPEEVPKIQQIGAILEVLAEEPDPFDEDFLADDEEIGSGFEMNDRDDTDEEDHGDDDDAPAGVRGEQQDRMNLREGGEAVNDDGGEPTYDPPTSEGQKDDREDIGAYGGEMNGSQHHAYNRSQEDDAPGGKKFAPLAREKQHAESRVTSEDATPSVTRPSFSSVADDIERCPAWEGNQASCEYDLVQKLYPFAERKRPQPKVRYLVDGDKPNVPLDREAFLRLAEAEITNDELEDNVTQLRANEIRYICPHLVVGRERRNCTMM